MAFAFQGFAETLFDHYEVHATLLPPGSTDLSEAVATQTVQLPLPAMLRRAFDMSGRDQPVGPMPSFANLPLLAIPNGARGTNGLENEWETGEAGPLQRRETKMACDLNLSVDVTESQLWSAENPALFTLVLALYGKDGGGGGGRGAASGGVGGGGGELVHCEASRVGLRTVSITEVRGQGKIKIRMGIQTCVRAYYQPNSVSEWKHAKT